MLCYFLLYSKVSQVHLCIYPLIFGFLSVLGHHGALSKLLLCSQFSFSSVQFSLSVMSNSVIPRTACSTPGFPVYHQLPKLAQTHVHQVNNTIQRSHPLSSPSLPAFNISQHQGLVKLSQFGSGDQSIKVSASASVPQMNIQD